MFSGSVLAAADAKSEAVRVLKSASDHPATRPDQWPEIAGHSFPTISMTTDYVAPAPMGAWVEGSADVIRATKSLVFIQGTASVEGVTILRFSGVYKIGPKRDYANPLDPFGLVTDTHAKKK